MPGLGMETLNDQNHLHRCTSDVLRRNLRNIGFRDQITISPPASRQPGPLTLRRTAPARLILDTASIGSAVLGVSLGCYRRW